MGRIVGDDLGTAMTTEDRGTNSQPNFTSCHCCVWGHARLRHMCHPEESITQPEPPQKMQSS